jgi:hypothetical protein
MWNSFLFRSGLAGSALLIAHMFVGNTTPQTDIYNSNGRQGSYQSGPYHHPNQTNPNPRGCGSPLRGKVNYQGSIIGCVENFVPCHTLTLRVAREGNPTAHGYQAGQVITFKKWDWANEVQGGIRSKVKAEVAVDGTGELFYTEVRPFNPLIDEDLPIGQRTPEAVAGCTQAPQQPAPAQQTGIPGMCPVKSRTTKVLSNAQKTAEAIFDQYSILGDLPIGIYRLNNPEMPECTYLVMLSGTQFIWHQANNVITDLMSSPGFLNEYFVDIVDAIYQYVPTGATLILAGHSLGGMEAQNVAADISIRRIYRVARVITFGAPLTVKDVAGTIYVRFATRPDPVPLLAIGTFTRVPHYYWLQNPNEREQALLGLLGGIEAHLSYPNLSNLYSFDALGNPRVGLSRGTQLMLGSGVRLPAPGFLLP